VQYDSAALGGLTPAIRRHRELKSGGAGQVDWAHTYHEGEGDVGDRLGVLDRSTAEQPRLASITAAAAPPRRALASNRTVRVGDCRISTVPLPKPAQSARRPPQRERSHQRRHSAVFQAVVHHPVCPPTAFATQRSFSTAARAKSKAQGTGRQRAASPQGLQRGPRPRQRWYGMV
jgi:hypothetical protein